MSNINDFTGKFIRENLIQQQTKPKNVEDEELSKQNQSEKELEKSEETKKNPENKEFVERV